MTMGIYCYIDSKDNKIVYVGKDSHIDKNVRYLAHKAPSNYNRQPVNRVLQKNPNRYIYQILNWNVKDADTLNALEISYIDKLKPKFNFAKGGGGHYHTEEHKQKLRNRKLSDEHKRKISEGNTKHHARVVSAGKDWKLVYQKQEIHSINKDFLQGLADKLNNNKITLEECRQQNNKAHRENNSRAISNKNNTTGFYLVTKQDNSWKYKYRVDGKRKCMSATSLKKLEKRVKDKGLTWEIINEENAQKSIEIDRNKNNGRCKRS